jgi:hypothetical protein
MRRHLFRRRRRFLRGLALGLAALALAAPAAQGAPLDPSGEKLAPKATLGTSPVVQGERAKTAPQAGVTDVMPAQSAEVASEVDASWIVAGAGALAIAALVGLAVAHGRRPGGLART